MIKKALQVPYEVVQAFLIANSRWPLAKVQSWMKHYFDPRSMYLYLDQDGQIQAAIQLIEQTLVIKGQKIRVFRIERFYNPREVDLPVLEELYQPAFDQASSQVLFLIGQQDWLPREKGFKPFDQSLSGTITYQTRIPGNPGLVEPWTHQDLYPVYEQFMQNFDGSIILNRQEFDQWLNYWLEAGYEILVSRTRSGMVNGFAVIEGFENSCTIVLAIYDQVQALLNLITHLQGFYDTITIQVSQAEDLSQLFDVKLTPTNPLYALSLHPELHSAAELEHENLAEIINDLELSSWNHLF